MKLRVVPPDAAGALASVHAAAFAQPWSAGDLAALARSAGVVVIAVEEDGGTIGFVMARRAADEAEILTLAVDPAARRRGVGRALVEAAAQLGAATLFLEVAQDNVAGRALYAACGFQETGQRRGYYARPGAPAVDALVLRRGA